MTSYNTFTPGDIGTLLISLLLCIYLGPAVIRFLRWLKFGQNINEDAPETHRIKQGTPTMGGLLIVGVVAISVLVVLAVGRSNVHANASLLAVLAVFVLHACLGFLDDYLKTKHGKSLGLKARQKLAIQVLIAAAFIFWRLYSADRSTTAITFWSGVTVDLGPWYYLLCALWMIGLSNAANLTDGLDGLATGLTVLASIGLSLTVFTMLPGNEQLPWFGYALAGACLGFLWFNAYPAKVFMGDTGSLAIGGGLAAMAIVGKQEILLLVLMAVFLMEMFSVIIQVGVVKLTGGREKGRRIFRMTPIHHHFEKLGWPETVVVARFWILGSVALCIALLIAPYISPWINR